MAYSKLTPEVIEPLIEALGTATQKRSELMSMGVSMRLSTVRWMAAAGISATSAAL